MSNWISVKDSLPKKEGEYLVAGKAPVTTLDFVKGKWHSDIFGKYTDQTKVTHWQPLPNPPISEPDEIRKSIWDEPMDN